LWNFHRAVGPVASSFETAASRLSQDEVFLNAINEVPHPEEARNAVSKDEPLGTAHRLPVEEDGAGHRTADAIDLTVDRPPPREQAWSGLPRCAPSWGIAGGETVLSEEAVSRRLAAILAADVVGYSRLMEADEEGTLARLKRLRRDLIDPKIALWKGRIVKTTGDGLLVEFASVLDAVRCAAEVQKAIAERNAETAAEARIEWRVGINLGDVIAEGDDIYGDGVNLAARLEALAEPGAVFVSNTVHDQVRDRLPFAFEDLGEKRVKNIARAVRVYRVRPAGETAAAIAPALPLLEKPSIAVLPFANLSGDPEQDYFADGMVEEILTALSRIRWLFVIARNSSFTYKGQLVDVKRVGRELGVRYVLEGSVRKAGGRVRITAQLVEAESGAHL
jgi:adenylate cyclase